MGNFTASEMFTIIVIVLIVFGPNRLPEIARKAGNLAAKARSAMDSLRSEIDTEYGDAIQPLRDARNELRAAGSEIKGQVAQFGSEVNAATRELKAAADDAVKPVSAGGPTDSDEVPGVGGVADKAVGATSASAPGSDPAEIGSATTKPIGETEPPVPQDGLELDGG